MTLAVLIWAILALYCIELLIHRTAMCTIGCSEPQEDVSATQFSTIKPTVFVQKIQRLITTQPNASTANYFVMIVVAATKSSAQVAAMGFIYIKLPTKHNA